MKKRLFGAFRKYPLVCWGLTVVVLLAYWFCLPKPLFDSPLSFVLTDYKGALLGARIAPDGQWRFPPGDTIPAKFIESVLTFEDRRFYYHPGIDPLSIGRAVVQNVRNGRVVSGGSTITMQVIRMALGNRRRTLWQKLKEMVMATRLELKCSKDEILSSYIANAPFGGNVIGLEAAAWRYYGKKPSLLSWAEAATLAVLPNSPGLIHPGRNRTALLKKRDRLLNKLRETGVLDSLTWHLAKMEELPEQVYPLPQLAPHLLELIRLKFSGIRRKSRIMSTVDASLQKKLNQILLRHQQILSFNGIHNLAAMIVNVDQGHLLAYAGNVVGAGKEHDEFVDVAKASRSTGSILKPFLYASMLHDGMLLP